jgi:hypothetical protein
VLVDHADAGRDRVAGVGEVDLLAVDEDAPLVGRYRPYRMFIRVDLPAPFSPRSPCTSPGSTTRSMASFATTPGNRLVMPCSSRRTVDLLEAVLPRASGR